MIDTLTLAVAVIGGFTATTLGFASAGAAGSHPGKSCNASPGRLYEWHR
jgi:hypothetical protein